MSVSSLISAPSAPGDASVSVLAAFFASAAAFASASAASASASASARAASMIASLSAVDTPYLR